MKKYKLYSLILIITLSLLTGCNKSETAKEQVDSTTSSTTTITTTEKSTTTKTTTTKATYKLTLNKEYVNEDKSGGSDYTFKSNNKFDAHKWAKDAGDTAYHGSYKIEGNTLTTTITEYQDVTGEWAKLPSSEIKTIVYTLTSNSSFVNKKGEVYKKK